MLLIYLTTQSMKVTLIRVLKCRLQSEVRPSRLSKMIDSEISPEFFHEKDP